MKKFNLLFGGIILLILSCDKDDGFVPASVDLVSPRFDDVEQPLNATLEWQNTNSKFVLYNYEVYLGKSKDSLELVDSTIFSYTDDENMQYECFALDMETKYYWKIRIKVDDQYSDSEISQFITTNKLPSIEFQDSTIMIFPSDINEYPDSLVQWIRSPYHSGALSWTDGYTNTQILMNDFEKYPREGMYIAAKTCSDLVAYGYSDWYLPSIVELDSVNSALNLTKTPNDVYWSSTEYASDANFGHTINYLLPPENLNSPYNIHNKIHDDKCRCIRKE